MSEVAEIPQVESTLARTPNTEHIEPVRRGDLRALLDLHKKGDFFPTKTVLGTDITRRDIIEYAYTRQMAYCLDQVAQRLHNFDFSADPVEKLHQDMQDVILDINTMPDGVRFTSAQRQAVEAGMNLLVDDLVSFRRDVITEGGDEYVRTHLGQRFKDLPEGSYSIDIKTYPGAVVVRVHSREDYAKVAPDDTQGIYNQALGEGMLKSRVLVVRGRETPDESIEYHEYLHFLNSRLRHLEPLPKKEKKAEQAVAAKAEPYGRRLDQLNAQKEELQDRKLQEMGMRGKASDITRQKLSEVNQQIDKYEERLKVEQYLARSEVVTYHDSKIRKAFDKVRNELRAYTIGGNGLPRRFVANTLGTGFADTLSKTTEGRLFLAEFGALKEILTQAAETDLDPQEIGFLVSGSRNLQQAAKFVYLHLQQAPKRVRSETPKAKEVTQMPTALPVAA